MHFLRIRWFVPPTVAVVADALQLTSGIHLQTERNPSSESQFEALSLGYADAVVTAIDNIMDWNTRAGAGDFKVVAQVERTTPLTLVSRQALRTVRQLRGATVLVDAPHNGFIVALRAILVEAGVQMDEYKLQSVGGVKERFDAILNGEGDATLLGPPFDAVALQRGLFHVLTVQERHPEFPGQGLVVRTRTLDKLRPALSEWLRCLEQAATQVRQNTDAVVKALTATGIPAEPGDLLQAIPITLRPDQAGINLLIRQRRSVGLPGADTSYAELIDLSALSTH